MNQLPLVTSNFHETLQSRSTGKCCKYIRSFFSDFYCQSKDMAYRFSYFTRQAGTPTLTLSDLVCVWGGGGGEGGLELTGSDDQIHSCSSETFYLMMPKLDDF